MGARDCIGVSALERYYECADGWMAIACSTATRSASLFDALRLHDGDAGPAAAERGEDALASVIANALRLLSRDEALTRLAEAGAPAAPVLTLGETYTDAFLGENNYYDSYLDPVFGPATGVSGFARFGRANTRFERAAPILGQHTTDVLRDYGISQARIDALPQT
jgi:crotonobetainyl-CoA:carnitine CoA-transferase CaiB-like acyl-CoA transferase